MKRQLVSTVRFFIVVAILTVSAYFAPPTVQTAQAQGNLSCQWNSTATFQLCVSPYDGNSGWLYAYHPTYQSYSLVGVYDPSWWYYYAVPNDPSSGYGMAVSRTTSEVQLWTSQGWLTLRYILAQLIASTAGRAVVVGGQGYTGTFPGVSNGGTIITVRAPFGSIDIAGKCDIPDLNLKFLCQLGYG